MSPGLRTATVSRVIPPLRLDKGGTSLAYLGPFPVEQRLADTTHVPEAGVGCLGQTRDAPCADAMC